MSSFRLKVQKIEQTCLFELSWGKGQQLSCIVNYPQLLTEFYQEWQRIYLSFYKSALRGRLEGIGGIAPPPVDWHAKLIQAEAKFLYEFHYWLHSAELFEIRRTIANSQFLIDNHQEKSISKEITAFNMMVEEVSSEVLWENLYQRTPPPRRDTPAGSRGDKDVCIIAPARLGKIEVVWSDRPLFLWQGSIGKLEVRPRNRQQVLWSYPIREAQNSVIYDGEALQPGQTYDLVVFNQRSIPILRATFQVMREQEIEGIRSDLSQLEAQMKQEGATEERLAYAKANYFASRGMWGDVLQVAYGVEEPSDSLNKFIEKVVEQLCLLD